MLKNLEAAEPSASNLLLESHMQQNLDKWWRRQELVRHQKSRGSWLFDGDKNTRFFSMPQQWLIEGNFFIIALKDSQGNWLEDRDGISA